MNRGTLIRVGALAVIPVLLVAPSMFAARGATQNRSPGTPLAELRWQASWRTAPQPPTPAGPSHDGMTNETIRMIVHPTVGGQELRVRLSNAYGTTPLDVGTVAVGVQQAGPTVIPQTQHVVTFAGSDSVTIPVGAEAVSDPISLHVRKANNLAISVYLPQTTGPTTWHRLAQATSYISTSGDWAAEPGGSPYQSIISSWFFLDGVDVLTRPLAGTIVAFGDSITDGAYSTLDADDTYPDWLARRVGSYAVLNEGIGGNEILADTPTGGESALHRFERDAVSQLGVTDVIFLDGVNDIGADATASQLIDAMRQLIAQAHADCLTIIGGTIMPFKDSVYFTAEHEQTREAVNEWIRTSGQFDGVADFDKALRDPADPLVIDPRYHTVGDLHPNDLGYKVMADTIDLSLLHARPGCRPAARASTQP
jgi:lysophospholipase L1-like esterase